MADGAVQVPPLRQHIRRALCQFGAQVLPFEVHLPRVHVDVRDNFNGFQLASVEAVVPLGRLVVNRCKVAVDGLERARVSAETLQLRVVPIAPCFSPQHGFGKQGFTLQGDQPSGIEITGVK